MNIEAIHGKKPMEDILKEYREKNPTVTEVTFKMDKIDFPTLQKFVHSLNPSNFDFATVKKLSELRMVLTDFYDKFAVLGGMTKVQENIREREKHYIGEFRKKEFEEEEQVLREQITINKELFKKKLIMKKATSRELYPEDEIVESLKAVEKRIDEPTTSEKERDKLQIERDDVIHDSLYCFCQEDLDSEEKKNNIREKEETNIKQIAEVIKIFTDKRAEVKFDNGRIIKVKIKKRVKKLIIGDYVMVEIPLRDLGNGKIISIL
ncbi:10325_t:CDS:2 [Funneliformis geosporum]|nr:10325_t:CDS:2 [Funneliformis geosporum]